MALVRILALGDVVGRPGRRAVTALVPRLREEMGLGFVVVNGENAAGGNGITVDTAKEMLAAGVDVLTSGDHFFDEKGVEKLIADPLGARVLRPANWSREAPGTGFGVYPAAGGAKVAVLNLVGRVFMRSPFDNFFHAADEILPRLKRETPVVVVDFHAEATSEKTALGLYLDGRASLVFGTHTHVQTADERVLPGGTAYVTDLGMTGPHDSIIGMDYESVLKRLKTAVPVRFEPAKGGVLACGVVATVDAETGRAVAVERVRLAPPQEATR